MPVDPTRFARFEYDDFEPLSVRFIQRLEEFGAVTTVGSRGDAYENALAETINGLFKTDPVRRRGRGKLLSLVECFSRSCLTPTHSISSIGHLLHWRPGGKCLSVTTPINRCAAVSCPAAHAELSIDRLPAEPEVVFNALEIGNVDDGLPIGLVTRVRAVGFDAFIFPQSPGPPSFNRREDLLFRRT